MAERKKPKYCPECGNSSIRATPLIDSYLCLDCGAWFTVLNHKNFDELPEGGKKYLLGGYDKIIEVVENG